VASRFYVPQTNSSTDFNSTNSWSASNGGAAGASVPGSSDDAFVYAGTNVITSAATHTVASVTVGPGSYNGFGDSGTSLSVGGTNMYYAGQGPYAFINGSWSGGVYVNDTGPGQFYLTGGTAATWEQGASGRATIGSGAGSPTTLRSAGARTEVGQSTSPITTFEHAGIFVLGRPAATINALQGSQGSFVATATGTVATSVTVSGGGQINDRSVGDKATVQVYPQGKYSAAEAKSGFTIGLARRYQNGTLDTNGQGVAITVQTSVVVGAR
jgi:hypothetical protein